MVGAIVEERDSVAASERIKGPSMPRPGDGPYRAPKVHRPHRRRQNVVAAAAARQRAMVRYACLMYVRKEAKGAAPSTAYQALERAFRPGGAFADDPTMSLPPRTTFLTWYKGASAIWTYRSLTVDDCREQARPGRPRTQIAEAVAKYAKEFWMTGRATTIPRLRALLVCSPHTADLPIPSDEVLRRFVAELDPAEVAAGRHGPQAAVVDHGLKLSIPAPYTHAVWTLDEAELPIYVRALNPDTRALEVVRPVVVLMIDRCSRAIVGFHLVEPFAHGRRSAAANSDDVLGTFWGAAMRSVAPRMLQDFAGYLPDELRMDNAQSHRVLREQAVAARVKVPVLPTYQPQARGDIERLVRTFKASLPDIPGRTDVFAVAELLTEAPAARQARNVSGKRMTSKTVIATADLLSVTLLRPHLEAVVAAYQDTPHDGLGGRTPRQAYFEHLPASADRRPGSVLLSSSDFHHVTVSAGGVVVRDRRYRTFDQEEMPPAGAVGHFVADPLGRGVWWVDRDPAVFLQPAETVAVSPCFVEAHHAVRANARAAADEANTARDAALIEVTGDPTAPARAALAADAALSAHRQAKQRDRTTKAAATRAARRGKRPTAAATAAAAVASDAAAPTPPATGALALQHLPAPSFVRPRFPGFRLPETP